jgi:cellulase/cellobiase CelA1
VDCGGAFCAACNEGQSCEANADCSSGNCQNGTCQANPPPAAQIEASLTVLNDGGTWYCASLVVSNVGNAAANGWSVPLDTRGTSIYTTWNGAFSGSIGNVVATPSQPWNTELAPGDSIDSVGFCATRPAGDTTSVASVSSAEPAPMPHIAVSLITLSDGGGWYCSALQITNVGTASTEGWNVTLDTRGTSIYTAWNGDVSGTTGNVTAAPNQPWNIELAPGDSTDSVGFCASRPSGNTSMPSVVASSP